MPETIFYVHQSYNGNLMVSTVPVVKETPGGFIVDPSVRPFRRRIDKDDPRMGLTWEAAYSQAVYLAEENVKSLEEKLQKAKANLASLISKAPLPTPVDTEDTNND